MMYGMVGKVGKLSTLKERETSGHQDVEDFIAPASRSKSQLGRSLDTLEWSHRILPKCEVYGLQGEGSVPANWPRNGT